MSIVQAYKSDTDGKLFLIKTDYTKHLRKLADNEADIPSDWVCPDPLTGV